jgi:hypothetical protein
LTPILGKCFFCDETTADSVASAVPVLLKGNYSYTESATNWVTKWAERVIAIPRCEACKLLHERAVATFGWRRLAIYIPLLVATLICLTLPMWVLIVRIANHFDDGTFNPLLLFLLLLGGFATLATPIIVGLVVQRVFDRHSEMKKLLGVVRPPDAYITFPPLAQQLHGDWKAYVSTNFLYGGWFTLFEICRGTTPGASSAMEHCYEAVRERELLHKLSGTVPTRLR